MNGKQLLWLDNFAENISLLSIKFLDLNNLKYEKKNHNKILFFIFFFIIH